MNQCVNFLVSMILCYIIVCVVMYSLMACEVGLLGNLGYLLALYAKTRVSVILCMMAQMNILAAAHNLLFNLIDTRSY